MPATSSSTTLTPEMRQALFALHAGLPSSEVASIFGYASPAWIRRQKNSPEGRAYLEELEGGTHAPELVAIMRVLARTTTLFTQILALPSERRPQLDPAGTLQTLSTVVAHALRYASKPN